MDPRKFAAIIILGAALSLGGCRKTKTVTQTNLGTAASPVSSTATNSQPAGGTAVTGQTKFFKGSIGSSLGLQMKLVRDGEQVTGNYFYQKVGTRIALKGTVDRTGNVTLDEYDSGGKQTGSFKGLWRTDNEDGLESIAGNWSKAGGEKKTAFSLHEEPIELGGGAEIVAKSIKENNKKLNYKIEVGYPEVTTPLANRFNKFNQEAKGLVTRRIAEFKKERADAATAEAQTAEPSTLSEMTSELSGDYTIALANDSLISMKYDIGGYSAGAAHGNSSSYVLNYDVKAGKVLKFADLFKPGAKYVQTISSYCIKDLKKQSKSNENGLPDDMIQSGAGPEARNFGSWTISRKGLSITFDAYQVGPYAAGPQNVLIPYSVLKDLINPDGPIGQFVK
ncbi:MAG TPA: RsiV family protein [Pyrinomonadaceae bacterium]|nr:RsiV family protein [Pyrinomonadaceae bacterium]